MKESTSPHNVQKFHTSFLRVPVVLVGFQVVAAHNWPGKEREMLPEKHRSTLLFPAGLLNYFVLSVPLIEITIT